MSTQVHDELDAARMLPFMTVTELYQWAELRQWRTMRIKNLEQKLSTYLIIPTDIELCRLWDKVRANRQKIGRTIAPQDAWIAATALRHQIPLITNNPSDFQDIPILDVRSVRQP